MPYNALWCGTFQESLIGWVIYSYEQGASYSPLDALASASSALVAMRSTDNALGVAADTHHRSDI
jgi:hypothetical protein